MAQQIHPSLSKNTFSSHSPSRPLECWTLPRVQRLLSAIPIGKRPIHLRGAQVCRIRLPRTLTIDGRLTTYDAIQATWQARFYSSSDFGAREYGEQFVHVFLLADRHFLLLTIERLFFFHSTLKRSDLPESNADLLLLEEHLEFPEHFGAKIRSCSILQLQVLALEQFSEAVHFQMGARDAQRLVRLNDAQQMCLDFGHLHPDVWCNFVEPCHCGTTEVPCDLPIGASTTY